ncbi:MAG: ABC transporter substrate-binding protein [bacterium]
MKKFLPAGVILFLTVLLTVSTTGCKKTIKPAEGKIELAFWGGWTGSNKRQMVKIVEDFNAKNKNIHVTLTTYEWEPLFNKLLTAYRGGTPPDVIAMRQTDITQYASLGILEPMDIPLGKISIHSNDFAAHIWEGFKYNGELYAMPFDIHMLAMFYNREMFEEAGLDPDDPPQDWESLTETVKKLTIRDEAGKVTQYGIGIPAVHQNAYRYWFSLLYQNGGRFLTPDGRRAAFNSPEGVEACEFLHDLIYAYKAAPEQEADAVKDFKERKIAIIFDLPWLVSVMSKGQEFDFAIAPFPKIFEKNAVWANSHGLSIPKRVKSDPARRDAVLKLLRFISDSSLEWAEGGQIPVRRSILESQEFKSLSLLFPFVYSIQHAVYLPKLKKASLIFAPDANTPMMSAMQEILLNKKTPQEALDSAAKQVDEILGKR